MSKLIKISFNLDLSNYLMGNIVSQNTEFILLQAIDQDGNLGGLEYIKKLEDIVIQKEAPEVDFYNAFKIKDLFNLKRLNEKFINSRFISFKELLQNISSSNLITIKTKNLSELTGYVLEVEDSKLIFELNTQAYPLIIPIEDILRISINDISNLLEAKYHDNGFSTSDLVALYLDYEDDDRFGEALIGTVIFHNDDYLVLKNLNEIGQLDSYVLINRDFIVHTEQYTEMLGYYEFLKNWQIQNGSFDPNNLREQLPYIDKSISIEQFLKSKLNKLTTINDYQLDNINTGKVVGLEDKRLFLKNIDDFKLENNIQEFNYSDLASVDLISNDLLRLKQFFK